jgi:hypothetical protein
VRLSIIPIDNSVYVDGVCYHNIDMSWIPDIDGKKVHAVQWLDQEGEIEFVGPAQNLKIGDLGIFEKAIDLWNEKKEEEDVFRQKQLEDEERRKKEEEERARSQFIYFYDDELDEDNDLQTEIDEIDDLTERINIAPSESHIPPIKNIRHDEENGEVDEDEDLFYDIEELLKEI